MSGLDMMKTRAKYHGGGLNDANVVGKYRSFLSALENSYQSADTVTLYDRDFKMFRNKYKCLINPNKVTMDTDQKEISIDFKSGIRVGDVFYWDDTKTYWVVCWQELTEKAYFRGIVRKCDYELIVGGRPYRVSVRGPVETTTIWSQKHNIAFNDLNYSIMFTIEANEETKEYFTRHRVIKFDGHNWVVAATDKYSQPGVMDVYIKETFDNPTEEEEAAPAPEIKPIEPTVPYIDGPDAVNPYDTNIRFYSRGLVDGTFTIDSKKVKIKETSIDYCVIDVVTGRSGSFVVKYSNGITTIEKEVTINSL